MKPEKIAAAKAEAPPEKNPQPIEDLPTTMKDHCISKLGLVKIISQRIH